MAPKAKSKGKAKAKAKSEDEEDEVDVIAKDQVLASFEKCDLDKNGSLSKAELTQMLKALGMKKKLAEQVYARVDTNKDGSIDYREFVAWCFSATDEVVPKFMKPDIRETLYCSLGHPMFFLEVVDAESATCLECSEAIEVGAEMVRCADCQTIQCLHCALKNSGEKKTDYSVGEAVEFKAPEVVTGKKWKRGVIVRGKDDNFILEVEEPGGSSSVAPTRATREVPRKQMRKLVFSVGQAVEALETEWRRATIIEEKEVGKSFLIEWNHFGVDGRKDTVPQNALRKLSAEYSVGEAIEVRSARYTGNEWKRAIISKEDDDFIVEWDHPGMQDVGKATVSKQDMRKLTYEYKQGEAVEVKPEKDQKVWTRAIIRESVSEADDAGNRVLHYIVEWVHPHMDSIMQAKVSMQEMRKLIKDYSVGEVVEVKLEKYTGKEWKRGKIIGLDGESFMVQWDHPGMETMEAAAATAYQMRKVIEPPKVEEDA